MQTSFNQYSLITLNSPFAEGFSVTLPCYLHPFLQEKDSENFPPSSMHADSSSTTPAPQEASYDKNHNEAKAQKLMTAVKRCSQSLQNLSGTAYRWVRKQNLLTRIQACGQSLRNRADTMSSPSDFMRFDNHHFQAYKNNRTLKRLALTGALTMACATQTVAMVHNFNKNNAAQDRAEQKEQTVAYGHTHAIKKVDGDTVTYTFSDYKAPQPAAQKSPSQQNKTTTATNTTVTKVKTAEEKTHHHHAFDNPEAILNIPLIDDFRVSSNYGMRMHPKRHRRTHHDGIDIAAPSGTKIPAPANGTVVFTGWKSGYGRTVIIDHGDNVQTLYAHLSKINVRQGQHITKDQNIATVGKSGQVTGAHLHFEIRKNGNPVNPKNYIAQQQHHHQNSTQVASYDPPG